MKVLFAVNNEAVSESIVKKYQQMYKEIILSKNVYYFNAILKEIQKDKTYDCIVISEDLEPFTNNNYEAINNFIFEKLDSISDEAVSPTGEDIPIILITTDRRTKSDELLIKLFGIGIYSALLGQDRSIEEVCKLIHKPRSKKEAKVYYKIDSNDVEYKPESETDVSETEIQNILTHYKRLGRNEDRYVESFDSIASQYTDQQLKVIIKFLPLNVKAVLEANSPKYQQLMAFGNNRGKQQNQYQPKNKTKIKNNTDKAISNSGIKVESIPSGEKKITKPVIIPPVTQTKRVEKADNVDNIQDIINQNEKIEIPEVENLEEVQEAPKRRGRPKKVQVQPQELTMEEPTKKRRGRPKKNIENESEQQNQKVLSNIGTLPNYAEEPKETMLLGSDEEQEEAILPGFDDEQEETMLPGFDMVEDTVLPGFEDVDEQETILPGFDVVDDTEKSYENTQTQYNSNENMQELQSISTTSTTNYENALTGNTKIVAFVGTTKNGTSFLVNNIAELISQQGIKTAILDLTKNRNSYYIFTKNEEELRQLAFSCVEKLSQGVAQGIRVNNNLDVYTSLPGENTPTENYQTIIQTLTQNYSLILLDCDFTSKYEYLMQAQEIYLVQNMDVLTIQPLTAYLRDLKAKGVLEQSKLRAVINQYTRVKGVTEKAIIGGMAFYNDPAMSFMTELFNRETVPYCTIPFDNQVYAKYLEGLVNCNISIQGYPKEFLQALKKLGNMVYPLIGNEKNNKKQKYENQKYNKYATNVFSSNTNSTLDKMRRNN